MASLTFEQPHLTTSVSVISSPAVSNTSRISEQSTFHLLARETRMEIFGLCLEWQIHDPEGRFVSQETPALLDAVRGDRVLYAEALAVFYKSNSFVLHSGNNWSLNHMPIEIVRTIRKIDIIVDDCHRHWNSPQGLTQVVRFTRPDPVIISKHAYAAVNVREVTIKCIDGDDVFMRSYERYLDSFNWLRVIRIEFPKPVRLREHQWDTVLSYAIDRGNRLFGTTGRLENVRPKAQNKGRWTDPHLEDRTWIWDAGNGRCLKEIMNFKHWDGPIVDIS